MSARPEPCCGGAASASWSAARAVSSRPPIPARECHLQVGQIRAAARAQAIAGQALLRWGRHAEAREQLTAALEVLRADPDTDTVRTLAQLAVVETFAGSPGADRLSAEALTLGQGLGVGDGDLSRLFEARAMYLGFTDRRAEAAAYLRESARLAGQAGDTARLGTALLNLSNVLLVTEPGAAADNARTPPGTPAWSATGTAWQLRPSTWPRGC
jgi:hypothetical protein